MAQSDLVMTPIAWLFISIFVGVILVLAIVYLFVLKVRRDKRKLEQKTANGETSA